jgi:hypothetical protein
MNRRLAAVTLSVALAGALTLAVALGPAGAAGPRATTQILGAAAPANASCPANCLVEAKVTGFQTSIGKIKNPFVVPADGNIVAWSLKLGKPKKPDRREFNNAFGLPQARLSILKKVPGSSKPARYKLLRQSPVEALGSLFGTTSTLTLQTPLPVKAGQVVALTIPTWAPAFATSQGDSTRWVASRRPTGKRGGCTDDEGRANVDAGAAQVKKGTQRPYGCTYRTARLLYSATLISE